MAFTPPADVLHGPKTWIDYDRPWLLQRQFLVTDYQASIMNNLIAMALTLSGPRLWIIIKRFGLWAYYRWALGNRRKRVESDRIAMTSTLSNMHIIEESHSELGASLKVLGNAMRRLQPHIEIPASPERFGRGEPHTQWITRVWERILKQPLDLLISLLLSIVFVGIFVAGASGSVFSAKITSDTVALANSRRCYPPDRDMRGDKIYLQAASYSQRCYRQPAATEGCGYFLRPDIPYIEKPIKQCPWRYNTCDTTDDTNLGTDGSSKESTNTSYSKTQDAAILLDTGMVDASAIGINVPKRYLFRRVAVCAPSTSPTIGQQTFGFAIGDVGGSPVSTLRENVLAEHKLGYPLWESHTILKIGSISYPRYRDTPIFRAQTRGVSNFDDGKFLREAQYRYFNNGTTRAKITCINHAQICDVLAKKCWYMPNFAEPRNLLISRKYPPYSASSDDPALVLLEACLSDSMSFLAHQTGDDRYGLTGLNLEAQDHCSYIACKDLPDDQWKLEIRRWFETSLALIQLNLLEIVRPSLDPRNNKTIDEQWEGIPDAYRGICHLGKFRATGWRNVSALGFLGLLGAAGLIFLMSCEMENGELWVLLALRSTGYLFNFIYSNMLTILKIGRRK